jgi:hypothetical protein
VIVWIMPWVGKLLVGCGGSHICNGGGGTDWALSYFGGWDCLVLGR